MFPAAVQEHEGEQGCGRAQPKVLGHPVGDDARHEDELRRSVLGQGELGVGLGGIMAWSGGGASGEDREEGYGVLTRVTLIGLW